MINKLVLASFLCLVLTACTTNPPTSTIENEQLREQALVTPVEERVYRQIKVGETELKVEIVDTPQKIQTGLGYRDEIGADGMLFIFPQPHIASFWMKGMRFDLDFIWIHCTEQAKVTNPPDCRVVDITENVPAPDDPNRNDLPTYQPKEEVNLILEVPAGVVKEKEISINDKVVINYGQ